MARVQPLGQATRCSSERYEHAEGPGWDARRGELTWVDIHRGRMVRSRPSERAGAASIEVLAVYPIGQAVSAAVPFADQDRGWILASEHGIAQLWPNGFVQPLTEPELGRRPRTRMNDGKCDPQGRFWAGSMAWSTERGAGRLYCLDLDGTCRVALSDVTISNGLAWSPDGTVMYYIDTPTRRVDRLSLDPDSGQIRSRDVAFSIADTVGSPDGMAIDDEGCLWVALWGGGAVGRYSPDGRLLARLDVPARQVSSCAFGGADGRTLFITTSQEGLDEARRQADPGAGYLYRSELTVSGPPAAPCRVPVPNPSVGLQASPPK